MKGHNAVDRSSLIQRYASLILFVSKRARSYDDDEDDDEDDEDYFREQAEAGHRRAGGEFVRTGTACLGSLHKPAVCCPGLYLCSVSASEQTR